MKENRFGRARVLSADQMDLIHHELPEGSSHRCSDLQANEASESPKLNRWRYVLDEELSLPLTTKGGNASGLSLFTHCSRFIS